VGGAAGGRALASCPRRLRPMGRTGPEVKSSLEDEPIVSNTLNGRKVRETRADPPFGAADGSWLVIGRCAQNWTFGAEPGPGHLPGASSYLAWQRSPGLRCLGQARPVLAGGTRRAERRAPPGGRSGVDVGIAGRQRDQV
jgi:hypothetical protein